MKESVRATHPFLIRQPQYELEVAWRPRDHIAPGEYPAFSRHSKIFWDGMYKRWVCLVNFDILDDHLSAIAKLGWFSNLGKGDKPHAGHRSKFWAAWILANSGRNPKRIDRLTASIFPNRHAVVLVRDVERDFRGVSSTEP